MRLHTDRLYPAAFKRICSAYFAVIKKFHGTRRRQVKPGR